MGAGIIFIIDKQLGVIRMKGILSYFISNDTGIIDSVNKAASSITETTTEGQLDQIFNSTKKGFGVVLQYNEHNLHTRGHGGSGCCFYHNIVCV